MHNQDKIQITKAKEKLKKIQEKTNKSIGEKKSKTQKVENRKKRKHPNKDEEEDGKQNRRVRYKGKE